MILHGPNGTYMRIGMSAETEKIRASIPFTIKQEAVVGWKEGNSDYFN